MQPLLTKSPVVKMLVLVTAILTLLAACQPNAVLTPTAVATGNPTQTPIPPTATPEPRSLVICLGQEPSTLYMYGSSSKAMWSVLEAVYDGPIDTRQFGAQPVILSTLPDFSNGDAVFQPVDVKPGDIIVNARGELAALSVGERVFPAGCHGEDCAVDYDGASLLQMDQLSLTYRLLPNLKWSDGSPLTAGDSVFSFNVSNSPDTPVTRGNLDRTSGYTALDDVTVQWVGLPGFVPTRLEAMFWSPLPAHALQDIAPADLLTTQAAAVKPLGWGPYQITEWVKGDHITLAKNPNYFRAAEGLPVFDTLVYRFLGEPADNNIQALITNECDVVDQTSLLDEQLEEILDLQNDGKLKAVIVEGAEWEHLDFGILHSSYDDGYIWYTDTRQDIFSDVRVRRAFAYCTDRQKVVDELLLGQSSVPGGFYPQGHPLYQADLTALPYDPAQGIALLEEVGWKELDGDTATPRTAEGMTTVAQGTPLVINYITTQAPMRVKMAEIFKASMQACGIQLNVQTVQPGELYAAGPDGPLFGRKFDLAQFAWEAGLNPPCKLYESSQIPSAANNWLTVNVVGYNNPQFDAACQAVRNLRPGDAQGLADASASVQQLFADDLPSLPLYFRIKMAISRPDFCGLEVDPTARSAMWNLEYFNYGEGCGAE